MNRFVLGLGLLVLVVISCKDNKKKSLSGDEPVDVTDFIESFPEIDLPYTVADSNLNRKSSDSSLVAYSVFTQFVPDSMLKKDFPKTNPKLYPLGRAKEKNKESYLLVKAVQGAKKVAYIIAFDKKEQYLKALPIVKTGENFTSVYGTLDRKFQITTYREKKINLATFHLKGTFLFTTMLRTNLH